MVAEPLRPDGHHEVTPLSGPNQSSILKLAVSAEALSPRLTSLLALQRAEEPETTVIPQEVLFGDLVCGLEDGIYDIGMTLAVTAVGPALNMQPLWVDELALAVPLRSPLLASPEVPLDALLHYPLLQWCLWACEALIQQVDARFGPKKYSTQEVTSFDLLAVLVAAGYGVGIAPRSRIVDARDWGVAMRPLANGPYPIRTQLLKPLGGCSSAIERFAARAAKIAATGSA